MVKLPPDLHVNCTASDSPSVHWSDATRRYHIWLNENGTPTNKVIHSNPIHPNLQTRLDEHRALKQDALKWSPLVAAIITKVKADDMIGKARIAAKAKERAEHERRVAEANQQTLNTFDAALRSLPSKAAVYINANLTTEQKLKFASFFM